MKKYKDYPIENMELPELLLIFEVVSQIRIKYRSRNNTVVILGYLPRFKNASWIDVANILGALKRAGIIKRHTFISCITFVGTMVSVTERFEPFYERLNNVIESKRNASFEQQEPIGTLSFDSESSKLFIGKKSITISERNQKSNPHKILEHIFNSDEGLETNFSYWEIAQDSFKDNYDRKDSWRKYYRACKDLEEKIALHASIKDFLIFTSGRKGSVEINKKCLPKG